jgi:hypothetical protein
MICRICRKEVHPLDAHMGRIYGELDVCHIDCWNEHIKLIKADSIYLEPLKVKSALNSELMKLTYRKEHKPNDISPLDYVIIKALAKQIPEKRLFDGVDTYICPSCREESYDEEYCQYCGQRLIVE